MSLKYFHVANLSWKIEITILNQSLFLILRLIEEEERAEAEAAAAAAAEKAERGPRKRKGGGFTLPELSSDDSNAPLSQAQILALARKEMKSQVKK